MTRGILDARGAADTIERAHSLSRIHLERRYLYPNLPVVISDAMSHSPALGAWTPDSLAARFGERVIVVSGDNNTRFLRMPLSSYVSHCHATQATSPGAASKPFYAHSIMLSRVIPELLSEFTIPEYFYPNWLRSWPINSYLREPFCHKNDSPVGLFIGPPRAGIGILHQDRYMTHSWISQVYGHKRVWLISPEQTDLLYPKPLKPNESFLNSVTHPDLTQFPKFAKARIYVADLFAGDTLVVPSGWWHFAECMNLSISLSANFVNDTNFSKFRKNVRELKALGNGDMSSFRESCILKTQEILCRLLPARGRK